VRSMELSIVGIIALIGVILVSMVVHESMHAYAGYALGDTTAKDAGRISLNPLSHIDPIMTVALPIITVLLFQVPILAAKPVPFDPGRVRYNEFGAAMIAFAGPLSNLVLAFLGALIAQIMGGPGLIELFVQVNVALFVFNLLPIPPLDGSRVLYAFAPEPLQNIMRQIEPFGLLLVFGLVIMGGLGSFIGNLNQIVLGWLPG
jgi:Zn-dependent protease